MSELRFAPLVRVSTDKQEKRGESLKTQTTDLEADIRSMGGSIYQWYSGSEHATPDYERKILDELIADAQKNKFDAVVLWSIDRWSRDDLRGPQDLKILRDNGIRFFIRLQEYNLNDEHDYFFIALYGLMGRTQAIAQNRRSMVNRIHRARQGIPTAGKLPYGRTFNKETGLWGIDAAKQSIISDAAKRYLRGESLINIAKLHGMNMVNLNKILKKRCGDTWEQEFISKKLNVNETVTTKVPRLLSDETIARIHARSEANKTYSHGMIKHSYLLARMIFCEQCGYAIFGQTNHRGKRYYRHPRDKGCKNFNYIPADVIENKVVDDVFRILGDKPRILQAVKDALPDIKERESLQSEAVQAKRELKKVAKAKRNLLEQVEKGTFDEADIKDRMAQLKEKEAALKALIEAARMRCQALPSNRAITRKANLMLRLANDYMRGLAHFKEMSFDDKRRLLQHAFNGKDAAGKRYGVYIQFRPKQNDYLYEIRGIFGERLDVVKTHGQRHAYHGLGLYQR